MSMDKIDRNILNILLNEGRISNIELANRINLSASATFRRFKQLEKKYITGYSANIDKSALDIDIQAFVQINLEDETSKSTERFIKAMENIEEIEECYITTGNFSYLVKVSAKDMASYSNFTLKKLQQVPGVRQISSNFILDESKFPKKLVDSKK